MLRWINLLFLPRTFADHLNHIQKIELPSCTISLREDGIIEHRFLYDKPYEIDVQHMLDSAEAMTTLSNGVPHPILSVAGLYGSITTDARKMDIHTGDAYTLALALVINELSQRLLANFYFKLKKVDYPVKTFKTEEEAVAWLQQQVRMHQKVG